MSKFIKFYTLNVYYTLCQLYFNKAVGRKRGRRKVVRRKRQKGKKGGMEEGKREQTSREEGMKGGEKL